MKKLAPKSNYFTFIDRIRNNPYLYVSMYSDAQQKLNSREFQLLQQKLTMGNGI